MTPPAVRSGRARTWGAGGEPGDQLPAKSHPVLSRDGRKHGPLNHCALEAVDNDRVVLSYAADLRIRVDIPQTGILLVSYVVPRLVGDSREEAD
jgi:hypothetical protein